MDTLKLFPWSNACFKDFAIAATGRLMTMFCLNAKEKLVILGATSRRHRSLIIEGCRHSEHLSNFYFAPIHVVSEVQRRQMIPV